MVLIPDIHTLVMRYNYEDSCENTIPIHEEYHLEIYNWHYDKYHLLIWLIYKITSRAETNTNIR